jgi:hypothetical protein
VSALADLLPGWDAVAEPVIIRIPADQRVWRFGDTFSIWENGDWWRSRVGSRRAWSTRWGAEDSLALHYLNEDEWRDDDRQTP